jgi:hypothetical protein
MPVARIRLPLKPANRKADRVDHRFGDNQSGKRKAVAPANTMEFAAGGARDGVEAECGFRRLMAAARQVDIWTSSAKSITFGGADDGTRTHILPITNRVLFDPGRSFQFSYVRKWGRQAVLLPSPFY